MAAAACFFFIAAGVVTWSRRQAQEEVIIVNRKVEVSKQQTTDSKEQKEQVELESVGEEEDVVLGEEIDLSKISVNEATLEELDTVPGVGEKTAQKILAGRPWENLEDVLNLINSRYRFQASEKLRL